MRDLIILKVILVGNINDLVKGLDKFMNDRFVNGSSKVDVVSLEVECREDMHAFLGPAP